MTPSPPAPLPPWIHATPEVTAALEAGRSIVALESTVITHGLPRPVNLELARQMEAQVRAGGAVPATVAVLDGRIRLGLMPDELERLALSGETRKLNRRDLGPATARGYSGGTTVSATMFVAHAASLRLFATGGIGGVHRGTSGDVSADLTELAETPVAVVCSGAKSILDLPRTVEWLETGRVPVIGWNTSEFPAFFSRESGLPVSEQVSSTEEVAAILSAHWGIGSRTGVLICVPCPAAEAVARPRMEAAIEKAIGLADSLGVSGKELTPFLLARVAELTGDASLKANLALLKNNARVAAQISLALASHTGA